ncbi:hypothetical protein ACVLV4_000171 [Rathayibacter agropyri]
MADVRFALAAVLEDQAQIAEHNAATAMYIAGMKALRENQTH